MNNSFTIIVASAFLCLTIIVVFGPMRTQPGEYSHKPVHIQAEMDDINWRKAGREFTRGVYQELLELEVQDSVSDFLKNIQRKLERD